MNKGNIVVIGTVNENIVKGWTFTGGNIALDVKEQLICGWTLEDLKKKYEKN